MRLIFASMVLLCAACTSKTDDTPKENHKTTELSLDKLSASYGAFSDGQKLEIFTAILGKDLGFMRLGDGDTLTVDVDGTAAPTTERLEDGKVHYIANVSPPSASPTVTITFARGADKSTAKVTLGPNFSLKAPAASTSAKVGDVVSVDLDPQPDLKPWQTILGPSLRHAIEIDGDCVQGGSQNIGLCAADSPMGACTVSYPLPWKTSDIKLVDGSTGCKLAASMRLETGNTTKWDGTVKGGMEAVQHRSFTVDLTK